MVLSDENSRFVADVLLVVELGWRYVPRSPRKRHKKPHTSLANLEAPDEMSDTIYTTAILQAEH